MDNVKLDDMIKSSLKKGTDHCLELKEELWERINEELTVDSSIKDVNINKTDVSNEKKYFKHTSVFKATLTAAVIVFIFICFGTTPGKAAVKGFTQMLQPKKNITIKIEGQSEITKVDLKQSRLGYIIYIDEALYTLETSGDKDVIRPKFKSTDDRLPEVFMEIQHKSNLSQAQLFKELSSMLKSQYKTVKIDDKVDTPVKSIRITAYNGVKWSDKVIVYLLIDDNHGGVFQVKQQYFFEASEGHGVRFDNMLKEFKIIETPK